MRLRSDNLSDAGFQNKITPEETCKSNGCYGGDLCAGEKALYECWKCQPLRLLGVALTDLTTDEYRQMSLFESVEKCEKQKKMDEAVDDIRRRFGNGMIVRGSMMNTAGKVARKAKAQLDIMDK